MGQIHKMTLKPLLNCHLQQILGKSIWKIQNDWLSLHTNSKWKLKNFTITSKNNHIKRYYENEITTVTSLDFWSKFQGKLCIHCSNFKNLTLPINFDHPDLSPTHGNEVLNSFRLSKSNETSLTTPLTTFVH